MSGPRLSIIPAGAVTDRSLEPRDLQVLCLLGRHTDKGGWCVRSQVKMAQELDCSRSSVQRSLDRLYSAGWVERKRRGAVIEGEEAGQPSASYAYRVILDREDPAWEAAIEEAADSHAENASHEGDYPTVGTPSDGATEEVSEVPKDAEIGHPGAQPYVGTGAQPYVGTNNDLSERPLLERERDARARDRKARFLVTFEARWPSAAADDRQRTAYAAEELTKAEQEAALAGIAPFLENLKRLGRKNVPAGWKYLEEKRWTLLDAAKPSAETAGALAPNSAEARAVTVLYEIAGKSAFLRSVMRSSDGAVWYRKPVTPKLAALAQAKPPGDWVNLTREQAGAWNGLLDEFVTVQTRGRLAEGSRAPWPWPPSKDGVLYAGTGPPDTLMTDADEAELHNLKAV